MFRDRVDAGRQLSAALSHLKAETPIIYGLARGGVPVAAEVARALGVPVHALLVRKIGAPWQPELAVGALVDGDRPIVVWNEDLVRELGLTEEQKAKMMREQLAALEDKRSRLASLLRRTPGAGRTVVLVDDGLATGASAKAALIALRSEGPRRLVLAIPVSPPEALRRLADYADEIVCLETPAFFLGVSGFYDDFDQTTDEQVARLLAEPGEPPAAGEA